MPGVVGVAWRCKGIRGVLAAVGQGPKRVQGETRRLGRTCVPNPKHARDVLDKMLWHARGFQTTRGLAEWGYRLGQIHETCWIGQGLKFTM